MEAIYSLFDEEGFAIETIDVLCYHTDQEGRYTGMTTEHIVKGTSLPANAYLEAPPTAREGYTIYREGETWVEVEDDPHTKDPDEPKPIQSIDDVRDAKINEINTTYSRFIRNTLENKSSKQYPLYEMSIWSELASEAERYMMDSQSFTPIIDEVLRTYQIDKVTYALKVIEKNTTYKKTIAYLTGQKITYIKEAEALEDIDALTALTPKYHLPQ